MLHNTISINLLCVTARTMTEFLSLGTLLNFALFDLQTVINHLCTRIYRSSILSELSDSPLSSLLNKSYPSITNSLQLTVELTGLQFL